MNNPMGSFPDLNALVTASIAGIAGLSGSYLVAGTSSGFVVVPVNAFLVDVMPAPVVTFSILVLGQLGERVGFVLALGIVLVLLGGATALALRLAETRLASSVYAALFGWGFSTVLTAAPLASLGTAVPIGIAVGILEAVERPTSIEGSRRHLLKSLGGVFAVSGVSYVIGSRLHSDSTSNRDVVESIPDLDVDDAETIRQQIRARLAEAESKSLDIDELPGLVNGIDEFYEVDINLFDPDVNAEDWRLSVSGTVANEFTLTYDELITMAPEHRFVTLRCVSDPVNGDLMDTALWTGVPARAVIDRADPRGDHVLLRGRDGYYVEFPLDAFESGFLTYGMNGRVLPRNHGFPVRALVPGRWGEVNAKWLTEIEFHDSAVLGYWERKGWNGTGPVHTVAKLWTVNHLADGQVQVAGHAYAGTRSIQAVEVSVDGGETWNDAVLSEPLDDEDVWRQWAYKWTPSRSRHTVVVRAIDGNGTLQPRRRQNPHPSGATGWVSKTISI